MKQPYDDEYKPPAPTKRVRIFNPAKRRKPKVVDALIDAGADATLLPIALLEQIEAEITYSGQMRGILGQSTKVDLYYVTIEVAGITLRGVRAIGMYGGKDESIIGRDVLNRL